MFRAAPAANEGKRVPAPARPLFPSLAAGLLVPRVDAWLSSCDFARSRAGRNHPQWRPALKRNPPLVPSWCRWGPQPIRRYPKLRRLCPDGAVFSGSSRRRGVKIGGSLFCGSPHPPPAANRNDCFAVGVAWVLNRSGHAVGTPLSCHGILAWGLSALGSLFLPGEPELLPSPSPSSPTGYPCGLLSPYPAPSIPLTLLLDATNGQTSCAIERITKVNSTYVEVQTFNGNTINRSRPIRTITAYIT